MVGITDFTVPEWGEVGSVFCLPNYRSSYEEDFVIKATKFVSWLQFEENISMYYGPGLVKLAPNWLRQGPG